MCEDGYKTVVQDIEAMIGEKEEYEITPIDDVVVIDVDDEDVIDVVVPDNNRNVRNLGNRIICSGPQATTTSGDTRKI